jgi:hypothetical protein
MSPRFTFDFKLPATPMKSAAEGLNALMARSAMTADV